MILLLGFIALFFLLVRESSAALKPRAMAIPLSPGAADLLGPGVFSPVNTGFVTAQGFPMQSATYNAWTRLQQAIHRTFGEYAVITSTTGGLHQDPLHAEGYAIDFVVPGITNEESQTVAQMASDNGFAPFNEYLFSSKYSTGPHMHVDLIGAP